MSRANKTVIIRKDSLELRNKKRVDETLEKIFTAIKYCVHGTVAIEFNILDGGITDVSLTTKSKIK